MHGGVRIGASHGFDERRDDVVVVVSVLVVTHGGHVHDLRHHIRRDDGPFRAFFALFVTSERAGRGFEDGQCLTCVAAGHADDLIHSLVGDSDFVVKAVFACDGAIDQRFQIVRFQRFEFDDHGSAEQRLDDGEAWVFRGGRDEGDVAVFHTGQQRILLRFGEAVHLVDEQHRFLAFGDETFVRAFEHITHVLDAGGDRGQFLEDTAGLFGDDIGEGGFADSGRSEQDDGARCGERAFRSGVGESAQWRSLPQYP